MLDLLIIAYITVWSVWQTQITQSAPLQALLVIFGLLPFSLHIVRLSYFIMELYRIQIAPMTNVNDRVSFVNKVFDHKPSISMVVTCDIILIIRRYDTSLNLDCTTCGRWSYKT
eukprot:887999_1